MNQPKGFSLIEVLVSLLLSSTLILALLQQQWQSKQLLNQLILRIQGTQLLDQAEEGFSARSAINHNATPIITKNEKTSRY